MGVQVTVSGSARVNGDVRNNLAQNRVHGDHKRVCTSHPTLRLWHGGRIKGSCTARSSVELVAAQDQSRYTRHRNRSRTAVLVVGFPCSFLLVLSEQSAARRKRGRRRKRLKGKRKMTRPRVPLVFVLVDRQRIENRGKTTTAVRSCASDVADISLGGKGAGVRCCFFLFRGMTGVFRSRRTE